MCLIISLIPATFWVILGYFVLFAASRADSNGIRVFGQILSIWLFVIAAAIVIGAGYVTIAGLCRFGDMFSMMHSAKP